MAKNVSSHFFTRIADLTYILINIPLKWKTMSGTRWEKTSQKFEIS